MHNKNKIYVAIMGGIGDQLFQFSFANFLRKTFKCEAYLDTTYYNSKLNYNKFKFRLYDLAKVNDFKTKNNNSYISYKYLSYLRIFNILKIDKTISSIYNLFFKIDINNFIYEYWKKNKNFKIIENSYYYGYWHNLKYIKPLKKEINNNLINHHNKKDKIQKFIKYKINRKTVCIHIRGGDFAKNSSHNVLDKEYYNDSIKFFQKKLINPNFHIFTNDIKFAKSILRQQSRKFRFEYIKSLNLTDIEEFSLFTKYKFAIIANSTFSLLSTYLSYFRKISIAPKIWMKGKALDEKKRFPKLKFI